MYCSRRYVAYEGTYEVLHQGTVVGRLELYRGRNGWAAKVPALEHFYTAHSPLRALHLALVALLPGRTVLPWVETQQTGYRVRRVGTNPWANPPVNPWANGKVTT